MQLSVTKEPMVSLVKAYADLPSIQGGCPAEFQKAWGKPIYTLKWTDKAGRKWRALLKVANGVPVLRLDEYGNCGGENSRTFLLRWDDLKDRGLAVDRDG